MNNRFKFRLYDKKIKEMIYADNKTQNNINIINYLIYCNNAFLDWDIENYALMQCTGLKDKNGKLIYEGDIVERENIQGKKRGVVEFNENLLEFRATNMSLFSLVNRSVVIGNIYENEDLLKCENQ